MQCAIPYSAKCASDKGSAEAPLTTDAWRKQRKTKRRIRGAEEEDKAKRKEADTQHLRLKGQ